MQRDLPTSISFMKNILSSLEGWHDYFLDEVVAGMIDQVRFYKMTEKQISLFFHPDKVEKKRVMEKIKKKLKENRQALKVVEKLIKEEEHGINK